MKKRLSYFRNIIKDYRFNSVFFRTFFLYFLTLAVTFALILLLVMNHSLDGSIRQMGELSLQMLDRSGQRLDDVIDSVRQTSNQLAGDEDIMKFLMPEDVQVFDTQYLSRAQDKIHSYYTVSGYTDSIYVYSYLNDKVLTDEDLSDYSGFEDNSWYENLVSRRYEPARMIPRLKENRYPYILSYIQPIRINQSRLLGCVVINLDAGKLRNMIEQSSEGASRDLFLAVDSAGKVIFANQDSFMGENLSAIQEVPELTDNSYLSASQNIFGQISSDVMGWKYITRISMDQYYSDSYHDTARFMGILLVIALAASFVVAISMALYGYRPFLNLLSILRHDDIRELDTEENRDTYSLKKDEMAEISLNIVRNLYRNHEMKEQVDRYVGIAEKAQATALQAQITPHFLYNTLENIRWKAYELCGGNNDISRIVVNLSKMLRTSLDNEKPVITIEEEVDNAKLYAEIIRIRMGDRIRIDWDIDERTLSLPVIKVCLQPLIENSIQHGLKKKRSGGIVTVRTVLDEDENHYHVYVEDNGCGMSEDKLNELRGWLANDFRLEEAHIGICNVSQRLKILLDADCSVELNSEEGNGMQVALRIPLKK